MTISTTPPRGAQHFADALSRFNQCRRDLALTPHDDDTSDEMVDRVSAAEDHLMKHAAPDFAAVLAKIEIACEEHRIPERAWIDGIRDDLVRLAGLDRSPTFCPLTWLSAFETRGGTTALLLDKDGKLAPQLTVPTDRSGAWEMVVSLREYEQAALRDHLAATLDPRDYGRGEAA